VSVLKFRKPPPGPSAGPAEVFYIKDEINKLEDMKLQNQIDTMRQYLRTLMDGDDLEPMWPVYDEAQLPAIEYAYDGYTQTSHMVVTYVDGLVVA